MKDYHALGAATGARDTTASTRPMIEDVGGRADAGSVREIEVRNAAILAAALDCIVSIDHDGRITEFNPAAELTFGHKRQDVLGRSMAEVIIPPAYRESHARGMARYLSTGETHVLNRRIEISALRADGSEFPVELSIIRMPVAGPPSFTAFLRDITERRRAAERERFLTEASRALGTSLDYEATLASIAKLAVPTLADWCAIDLVDEEGAIQHVAVAHVDPARVDWARELRRRYPPLADAPVGAAAVIRTGTPLFNPVVTDAMIETVARDADHLRLLHELGLRSMIVAPLSSGGRTLGAITLVAADSGRRYTESDLALAVELGCRAALAIENARLYAAESEARRVAEAANKAKSDFLAVMSHELRTPLNAIDGYAELLELELRGPLTEAQRSDLASIRRSQRTLLARINDVLNFARIDAGHVELELADVSLEHVINAVEELTAPQLQAKGLVYESKLCDVSVCADPDKLSQILLNLLSNAVKFTPEGGRIALMCGIHDGEAVVQVSNTGVGIPGDKLEAIFEPFVQVQTGLTRETGGTGLGLSISRELARRMGGNLIAESETGVGSTFKLTLCASCKEP